MLYLTAKPAIEEFGLGFVFDSRWAVTEILEKPAESPAGSSAIPASDSASDTGVRTVDTATPADEALVIDDIDSDDEFDDDIDTGEESDSNTREIYGGAVPIVGTIFSTLIAMIFSIPIAMGVAVFLSEIANEFTASIIGTAIELLAAIPSIIYGMWALFYFGPFIASIFGGSSVSLLVAGLVLGIMVLPFMAALSRDAINTTPNVLKESAYAMGATKFEVIKDVIFPYAKTGIIGSVIISLGRAMGETMAVAFVIGGIFKFAQKPTDATISVPVVLANNFAESSGMSMHALFYLSLILFLVSIFTIYLAKYFFLRKQS